MQFLLAVLLAVTTANPGTPIQLSADQYKVHSNSTVTASSSVLVSGLNGRQADLIINVKASPTGTTPTIAYTLQAVDPGDLSTVVGTAYTGPTITGITTQTIQLPTFDSHIVKVSWTVTGTTPSFTQVYATFRVKQIPSWVQAIGSDSTTSGTINAACLDANINSCAANTTVSINVAGQAGSSVTVPSSTTLIGTLKPDCSFDGGTTWTATYFDAPSGSKTFSQTLASATVFTSGLIGCGGASHARVRLSAFTSGTAVVSMRASFQTDPSLLFTGPTGGSQPPVAAQLGAWTGGSFASINALGGTTVPTAATTTLPVSAVANLDYWQSIVQNNVTLTASGSSVVTGVPGSTVTLYINIKANPTGTTPTLLYTLQEVDPGDQTTVIGASVSTATMNAITQNDLILPITGSGAVKVSWTITGTTPNFTQVWSVLRAKQLSQFVDVRPSLLAVTATGANATATATLAAGGNGLYHYITRISVVSSCTTAITGSALLTTTTTNLSGSLAWTSGNACAIGTTNVLVDERFSSPMKSSVANTATTVVVPAIGTAGTARVNVYYYLGY